MGTRASVLLVTLMVVGAVAAGSGSDAMKITTSAFESGGTIPVRHTCDGDDVSPALTWSDAPDGTKSFALVMDDPDAPPGTWVHWVLFNLPAETCALDEDVPEAETLASGAVHGACWGVESFSRIGYHGPCPPPGKPHRYFFRLYALDTMLALAPRASKAALLAAAEGHVLGDAELMGTYGR